MRTDECSSGTVISQAEETGDAFMRRAIELSQKAMDEGAGPPFGAVIVRNGQVIADGYNNSFTTNDPTAHAEIVAIRRACELGRVLNWVFRFGAEFGSWVVGGYGADRCDAMAFVTTSGTAFAVCCRGSRAMSA